MAWLLWGREISSGELHTTGGPSWKPLPVLITTVLAAAGEAAPTLWLVVARAGLLGSAVLAFVVAYRLAGVLAGCLAAGVLLLASWMLASGLRGYSEGIAVLLVLAAFERHDRGRAVHAFWLGTAAALLRPEAALFVGLYGLWLTWREPRRLPSVVAAVLLVAALWTLPELWGSGNPWRAAERAQDVRPDSAALAAQPTFEIVKLAIKLVTPPGALVAIIAVWLAASGVAPASARPLTLQLATFSIAWTALVAAMTELGFAGNWRYLAVPAALTLVLAAAGVGWLVLLVLPRLGRASRWLRPAVIGFTAAIVATYVVLSVPATLRTYAYEVDVNQETELVLARVGGGARLSRCGRVYVNPFLVQRLAWELDQPSMTITAVHRAPADVAGAIMRTRLTAQHPVLPRRPPHTADAPTALTRTEHWEVELFCDAPRDQASQATPTRRRLGRSGSGGLRDQGRRHGE